MLAPLESSQDNSSRPSLGKLLDRGHFERPNELVPEGFQFPINHLAGRGARRPQNSPRKAPPGDGIFLDRANLIGTDIAAAPAPASTHPQTAQARAPASTISRDAADENDCADGEEARSADQTYTSAYFGIIGDQKQSSHDGSPLRKGQESNQPAASNHHHQRQIGQSENGQGLNKSNPKDSYHDESYDRVPFPPDCIAGVRPATQSGPPSPLVTMPVARLQEIHSANKAASNSASKMCHRVDEVSIRAPATRVAYSKQPPARRGRKVAPALPDLTFRSPEPVLGPKAERLSRGFNPANMTRPLREVDRNERSPRPVSTGSNISRRRSSLLSLGREASTPTGSLTKGRTSLAQAWNNYFEDEMKHRQHIETENNRLKATREEYEKVIDKLQHDRAALLTANENLEKSLDESNQKLGQTTEKVDSLATKCQEYKKRLNDATDEQQKLYTKSKKMIQDTKEELEKCNKCHEAMIQAELDKSELARQELHNKVTIAVADARERIIQRESRRNLETRIHS